MALIEDTCNSSSPNQRFSMPSGALGGVTHTASNLCILGGGSMDPLVLGACGEQGVTSQWAGGSDGAITNGKAGAGCMSFNAINDEVHNPGNAVISYACDSPPQWNEVWLFPAAGQVGVIQAKFQKGGGASNLCLAALPTQAQWTLPFLKEWSLKDF